MPALRRATATAALLALGQAAIAADPPAVPYPTGYRDWTHVKSMVIGEGHPLFASFGGIHHLYANEAALRGYRDGGTFPTGSVIVFDLLAAESAGSATTEGARKVLGVMVKDPARWPATGGWGFEGFAGGRAGERAVGTGAKAACFDCHAAQRASDYTFSAYRE